MRTHFQPRANPHDASRKRVAHEEKDPAMGNTTASSPRAWQVQYMEMPAAANASKSDAGPLVAKAAPLVTKSPVPGACRCEPRDTGP